VDVGNNERHTTPSENVDHFVFRRALDWTLQLCILCIRYVEAFISFQATVADSSKTEGYQTIKCLAAR